MKKGHSLSFGCIVCGAPIAFSVLELTSPELACPQCFKLYCFSQDLIEQLRLFEGLCTHIYEARSLLGKASIAIDFEEHHIQIPFNILLTRLTSELELQIEGHTIPIAFRVDPIQDVQRFLSLTE